MWENFSINSQLTDLSVNLVVLNGTLHVSWESGCGRTGSERDHIGPGLFEEKLGGVLSANQQIEDNIHLELKSQSNQHCDRIRPHHSRYIVQCWQGWGKKENTFSD